MNRNILTAGITAAVVAALTVGAVSYATGNDPDHMTTGGITILHTPTRALDERETGQTDRITLPDRPWWATAALTNVAVVDPDAAGYLTLWDCETRPSISHLNYSPGQTESNLVAVPLALGAGTGDQLAGGDVCIYTNTSATVVIDLIGWAETDSYAVLP